MSVVVSTTFTGTNGAAWPAPWTTNSGTNTIQTNRGQQVTPTGTYNAAESLAGLTLPDGRVDVTVRIPAVGNLSPRINVRWNSGTGNGYRLIIPTDYNGFQLVRVDAYQETPITEEFVTSWAANTDYRVSFEFKGRLLRAKRWVVGETEPTGWGLTATDTTHTTGDVALVTLNGALGGAVTGLWDDVSIDNAPAGLNPARVGFHNDAFLGSFDDLGTYTTFTSLNAANTRTYLAAQTATGLPMGGESAEVNGAHTLWPDALADLTQFRWTFLNPIFHPDVIASWGSNLDIAARRLGYRLRLTAATLPTTTTPGGAVTVSFTITNDGFAAIYRARPVNLVFVNGATVVSRPLTLDLRTIGPGATVVHTQTVTAPPAAGSYSLHLEIPDADATLAANPAYSLQLANTGMWDASTGRNALGRTTQVGAPAGVSGVASAALGALTATATGTRRVAATASASLGALAATAAGTVHRAGTASAPLGALAGEATGKVSHLGAASASMGALTAAASGTSFTIRAGTASAPLGGLAAAASGAVRVSGIATAPLGALATTVVGTVRRAGTATAPLGSLTASGAGLRTVRGVASAPLGALTATAAGTRTARGTATAPLGTLVATAVGTRRVSGVAAAPLGGLSGTVSGTVTRSGTATAPLGALTATASGVRSVAGVASAPLGSLAANASGLISHTGTASAQLGAIAAAATGIRVVVGAATAGLGELVSTAVGGRSVTAVVSATLGALTATATGRVARFGVASAQLGELAAISESTGQRAGTADADLGALVATATGSTKVSGVASAPLGELDAATTGRRTTRGTATAALGALTGTATGRKTVSGAASAALGGLQASAVGTRVGANGGVASAPLGALVATSAATRTVRATAAAPLGTLTSAGIARVEVIGTATANLDQLTGAAAGQQLAIRTGTATAPLGQLIATAVSLGDLGGWPPIVEGPFRDPLLVAAGPYAEPLVTARGPFVDALVAAVLP